MTREKHFSTILGSIFLVACIAIGIYLTKSKLILGSKASSDCRPLNPQVVNITNTTADISFVTTAVCSVSVSVNNQIFNDVKSTSTSKIHYFQIKNLSAVTSYHYSLISNGQAIDDNTYIFQTGSPPLSPLPVSNLAWGRVLNPDKKTAANAIVYLNIPGSSPLSSFITTDGNWSISLASSFNDSKKDWFTPPSAAVEEEIIVISEDNITTQVINTTNLNNPVPDIIIGQNSLSAPISSPITSGNLSGISPVSNAQSLDILNPRDGETLNNSRPEFFGTAPINSKVVIEVHSDVITTADTQSDITGSWHWSPPENLTLGDHTIIVKVQDPATGSWQSISRNFTVLAANNNSLAFVASGSATTITTTPTPTLTSKLTTTPTSTLKITPTTTSTITPTSVVRVAHPSSSSSTPPVSGNSLPTVVIIGSALIFFVISVRFIY